MLGAIVGDMVGSRFEAAPIKTTAFDLCHPDCRFTDDTVLTVATAAALLQGRPYDQAYRSWARRFPGAGYGGSFFRWMRDDRAGPYGSWGNGSAMRVSPVAWWCDDVDEVLAEAGRSAQVTHDHPAGIAGAQATALAVLLARKGWDKGRLRAAIEQRFGYDLRRSLEAIRPGYRFDVSCAGSVPEALICFLEADSFEQAVRNAVSLGGDADTQAAIAGAVAEAAFGLPPSLVRWAVGRLPEAMARVLELFGRQVDAPWLRQVAAGRKESGAP